jgi:Tfp pilus assembly pilus retraction ATPase PilT
MTGREEGMLCFDETIRQLFQGGKIARDVAEKNVRDPLSLTRSSWGG